MKLASQIRQHRTEMGLSQDALAERVFVSRQTVSNWETNRSYPDIGSVLRTKLPLPRKKATPYGAAFSYVSKFMRRTRPVPA